MPYKNIEDRRKAWRRWKEKNPEKYKEHTKKWKESDYAILNKQQEGLNKKYRRKLIKERGLVCEECGSIENIDMHHIDYDNKNNSDNNLILLCRICHRNKHK